MLSSPGAAGPRRCPEGKLSPRAGSMSPGQSATSQCGRGFHATVSIRGSPLTSPVCWSCRDMEGFLIRGWERILPACGKTSSFARGQPLAAHWLHDPANPQPVSAVGFPHRAGRYRLGRSLFSSQGCWSYRGTKRFMIRGIKRYPLRARRDPDVGQRGNSGRALAP